jgi:hypothetical protein
MKGSGKQILLQILSELSTRVTAERGLAQATRRLRAGLLLHGSTADESFESASHVSWASGYEDGVLVQQGIAIGEARVLLVDLFDTVFSMKGLEDHVAGVHPELGSSGFEALRWTMWLLVSSVQMYSYLVGIENVDELDVDAWVDQYSQKYDFHFKQKVEPGTDGDV